MLTAVGYSRLARARPGGYGPCVSADLHAKSQFSITTFVYLASEREYIRQER